MRRLVSSLALAAVVASAVFLPACGGAHKGASDDGDTAAQAPPTPEQRLRAAENDMCGRLCPRLTQCSLQDARASNLPKKELDDLAKPEILKRHTAKCRDACQSKELSPRQVKQADECLQGQSGCAELLDCLDKAKPEK